jgi:hypothetical protein
MSFESSNILFLILLFLLFILDLIFFRSTRFRMYSTLRVILFSITLIVIAVYISFLMNNSNIIKAQ